MAAALPYITVALAAAGTGASVYSANQQADYQSAVAKNNQTIAGYNATLAQQKGAQQAEAKQRETAALVSRQRAVAGAEGVELDSGSPLKIQSDTAKLGKLDELTIRDNAAREAWNYRVQGSSFGAEGRQAQTAGNLEAFSSLIGGASSVSSKWEKYHEAGVW